MDHIMDNMMRSMMMPFGGMFGGPVCGPQLGDFNDQNQMMPQHPPMMFPGALMPTAMFGMDPFQQFMPMPHNATSMSMSMGPTYSYSSSSMVSYTTDEHGQPQVRQQSQTTTMAPNGVRETKSSLRDTRTGHNELAIGHHIHDKGHIKKRTKNMYTGDEEQVDELVNLDDEEASQFDQEWEQKARAAANLTANHAGSRHAAIGPHGNGNNRRLAITAPGACPQPTRERVPNAGESSRRSRVGDTQSHRSHQPNNHKVSNSKPKKKSPKRPDRI